MKFFYKGDSNGFNNSVGGLPIENFYYYASLQVIYYEYWVHSLIYPIHVLSFFNRMFKCIHCLLKWWSVFIKVHLSKKNFDWRSSGRNNEGNFNVRMGFLWLIVSLKNQILLFFKIVGKEYLNSNLTEIR